MLHAKILLVDRGWANVGSATFDNRSLDLDLEVNVAGLLCPVSYGRELQGDVAAAAEALEAAARVAPGRPEKAFTFQLGELHWNAGRVPEAVAAYRRASALDAGLRPAPGRLARERSGRGSRRPIGMDRRKSVSSLRTRRSK